MDADKDLNFAIGWNQFNLGLVGIWPSPLQSPGRLGGLSRCRFTVASFFMLGFMCIPQSVNLLFIWGNVDMMTENLATANIPVANAFMKAFTIWHHRKALKSLVNYFYQDWRAPKTSDERAIMLKNARIVRKISIWCTILTQSMLTIYIILRLSMIVRYQRDGLTRPLPYTAYFPFDTSRTPIFELICACQIVSAYSATVSYTGSDSFISMLVIHTCGQFQTLRERLKNLAEKPDKAKAKSTKEFESELKRIVTRHEHLNWFAKTIENSFNLVLLIQILSCTVQLCFQGFQMFTILMTEDELPTFQLIFLGSFVSFVLVHLYIYCYIGEMLLVQGSGMGFSAYESNWFNLPGKEARNLLLVMHRSTAPLCLTAGKFGVFSLQLFGKILKTSVGYLSVLLTVTDRKS